MDKPYLVHWSDDSDHNTETVATLDEAQDEIDRWLDLRRREAETDEGWALDMTGCIAVIVERVVEEESEAPEGSSFDRCVDYHRETVPDPRDARIVALESENAALRAQLAAPLRLGRGPTVGEVEAVAAREPDGLWLIRGGEDEDGMAAWSEERLFVEGGIVRVPARWGSMPLKDCIVTDAIPLNASRQPCRVGVTQGQAVADAFKDLAKRQASLGAEASAALTAQDLWDMHDTGEKEIP